MRHGIDEPVPKRDGGNTFVNVYGTMMLQVARDFAGLPDVRTMTYSEIRFFYNGLRAELRRGAANG